MEKTTLATWLAIGLTPGIGPVTFFKLYARFPELRQLITTPASQLIKLGCPPSICTLLAKPDWSTVEHHLTWAECDNHHIITWQDTNYPTLLKEIKTPPPILFVRGNVTLLNQHQHIAIVGSRNPTATGCDIARHFAHVLSENHFCITSGLALGIDAVSHQEALATGGKTCAVVGTGLDHTYPRKHHRLMEQISHRGVLVSEFPLGTKAHAKNFPQRNRIISGLAAGVLVVEAAIKSGSLITAHYAVEQNKEVFAVPGSIYNPRTRGCHALIQQGAKLTATPQDILDELTPSRLKTKQSARCCFFTEDLDFDQQKLVKCIGYDATAIDVIVSRCGFPVDKVGRMLTALELQGYVTSTNGNYVRTQNAESII